MHHRIQDWLTWGCLWIIVATLCCRSFVDGFASICSVQSSSSFTTTADGRRVTADPYGGFAFRKIRRDHVVVWNSRRFVCDNNANDNYNTPSCETGLNRRCLLDEVKTRVGISMTITGFAGDSWSCHALSPEEASTAYDSYAKRYDQLDGGDASAVLGITEARSKLMRRARGNVLEIGAGTGLNLPYYDVKQITSLTLVDISDGMLEQAKQRALQLSWNSVPVTFVRADATRDLKQQLGQRQQTLFDTVVDTFSLCVMGNEGARQCLYQLRDIVKDGEQGGQILLLENSKSSQPLLAWYQDVTAESAATMGGKGCVYNQNVRALIESVPGLVIESEESYATGLFRAFACTKRQSVS